MIQNVTSSVPRTIFQDENTITNPYDFANIFNNYFCSVAESTKQKVKYFQKYFSDYFKDQFNNSIFIQYSI